MVARRTGAGVCHRGQPERRSRQSGVAVRRAAPALVVRVSAKAQQLVEPDRSMVEGIEAAKFGG